MMTLDVKRAHFHAPASGRVYVELPPEDALAARGDVVGRLQASMYGTRDAAFNWEAAYCKELLRLGFLRGRASGNHFHHPGTGVRALVHGDDFLAVGFEDSLQEFQSALKAVYPCVSAMIGPDAHHEKSLEILGREIRLVAQGVEVELNGKYLAQALKAYGLDDAKSAATPATREDEIEGEGRRQLLHRRVMEEGKSVLVKEEEAEERVRGARLPDAEDTTFRSVAALVNFILPERPDVMYAGKEVLRGMAKPGTEDVRRLKRLLRYMKGKPRRAITFSWDEPGQELEISVDSDFAGCLITRRSTCGGCIRWRGGLIRGWSKTMPTIALSTAEAELGAAARGGAEGIGIQSTLADFGVRVGLRLRSDATAAIGISQRLGLGKVRHLSVADLWLQQKVRDGDLAIEKVDGRHNPSDMMTKPLDGPKIATHLCTIGLRLPAGAPVEKNQD